MTDASLNQTRCLIGSQCNSRKRSGALALADHEAWKTTHDRNVLHPLKSIKVPLSRAIEQAVAVVESAPHNGHSNCFGRLQGEQRTNVPKHVRVESAGTDDVGYMLVKRQRSIRHR